MNAVCRAPGGACAGRFAGVAVSVNAPATSICPAIAAATPLIVSTARPEKQQSSISTLAAAGLSNSTWRTVLNGSAVCSRWSILVSPRARYSSPWRSSKPWPA